MDDLFNDMPGQLVPQDQQTDAYTSSFPTQALAALFQRGPFVGRMTKMSRLMEVYTSVQSGHSRVVTIKGEAGIGKTRMATEFLHWAATQGADVLQGRAFEAGGHWPYQPLIEILQQRSERDAQVQTPRLSCETLYEIVSRMLSELHSYTLNPPPPGDQEKKVRNHLFEAFTLLGQALARQAPIVLFVDDIHWADTASLALLHYASRCWMESKTPILVLLSLRTEALVTIPIFAAWLTRMERDLQAPGFIMNALVPDDIIQFVRVLSLKQPEALEAATYLEGFGRWLYAETRGQPFYMTELLKALLEHDLLTLHLQGNGTWMINFEHTMRDVNKLQSILEPGARSIIRVRLKQLTPAAVALLCVGAIFGRSFAFEHVCRTAGLSEQRGRVALNELLVHHFYSDVGAGYFFTHDKIREAVDAQITSDQRRVLHQRVLDILLADGSPAALLGYHAQAAGAREQAFHWHITAGDSALRLFALRDAVGFYQQALQFLVEQQIQSDRPLNTPLITLEHLYLQLGQAYELLNEREHALATYQAMFTLAQRLEMTTLACIALNQLASITMRLPPELPEAALLLKRALAFEQDDRDGGDREDGGSGRAVVVRTETEWRLAQLSFHRFDATNALLHGEQALHQAREQGQPALIARALYTFAFAKMLTGEWQEVEELAEEARAYYEREQNWIMEASCLVQIAHAKMNTGYPRDGIIAAREAYLIFTQAGYNWGKIYAAHHLVTGLLDIGAYGEALLRAQEAVQLARVDNISTLLYLALTASGRVQRALLDLNAAHMLHREALTVFPESMPQTLMGALSAELCADCALASEWAEAQSYATLALANRAQSTFMYVGLTRWYETEILVRTGYSERAAPDVERFGALIGQSRRFLIPYRRAQSVLALWCGEFEQAHQYLQEATLLIEEIDLPGERWSLEAARGELCLAQGDKAGARMAFSQATEVVMTLADTLQDQQVRARFLSAQQIQRVIANAK